MKIVKMLLWAAFSVSSIGVVAQNRSKKELMKMEVMKTKTSVVNIANGWAASNKGMAALSVKEQMKRETLKMNNYEGSYITSSVTTKVCVDCIALISMSPKEQMKHRLMNRLKCNSGDNKAIEQSCKCTICDAGIISVKSTAGYTE